MDKTLNTILKFSGLSSAEKEELKETFYRLLALRTLIAVGQDDPDSADTIKSGLKNKDVDIVKLSQVMESVYANEKSKEKVDGVVEDVVDEMVSTITSSATPSQKRQILAALLS